MLPRAHTKDDWDKHAEEIRELLKRKTFQEVAAYMEAERNFSASYVMSPAHKEWKH
jgi:hypothetical protein